MPVVTGSQTLHVMTIATEYEWLPHNFLVNSNLIVKRVHKEIIRIQQASLQEQLNISLWLYSY